MGILNKIKKCKLVDNERQRINSADSVKSWWAIIVFVVGLAIFALVYLNFTTLPDGLLIEDEKSHFGEFIAQRAFNHLKNLTYYGPRVSGSNVNDVIAVKYLIEAIDNIKSQSNGYYTIDVDLQSGTGSYHIRDGSYGTTTVYRDVQNVVVKLSKGSPKHSLLLNAHFDSVPTSPGAGDDGSMTVILLEILRVLAQQTTTDFKHGIIFLFNGCEENLLQGSHAFISSHKWAKEAAAFINLDSAGNGGREIMFQAGPKHPWLMNYYRKVAPRPYGTAMAEELFQADMVPSDTDFRQFRDYGEIPGMDFAYATNGFLYHTKYDALNTIPLESLQHTGENILELIKELANAEEMYNIEDHADGKVIFFDYLNWFMVYYTETDAIILNTILSVGSIVSVVFSVLLIAKQEIVQRTYAFKELGWTIIAQVISCAVGFGLVIVLGIFYDGINYSLSWLSSPWLLYGLYFAPFFFCLAIGPVIYYNVRQKYTFLGKMDLTLRSQTQLFLDSQALFFTLILICLTIMGVRSSYLFMIPVFFYTIFNIINMVVQHFYHSFHLWVTIHFVGLVMPYLYYCAMGITIFATFLSLVARSGPSSNPEFLISVFSLLVAFLVGAFIIPFILLCRNRFIIAMTFAGTFLIYFILMLTPIGFPYREDTTPQRYWIQHSQRKFADNPTVTDSGFYLHPLDRHANDYLEEFLDTSKYLEHKCDSSRIYCGYPYYHSRFYNSVKHAKYYKSNPPSYTGELMPTLTPGLVEIMSPNLKRYYFSLSGPDHMSMYISPKLKYSIENWSFTDKMPESGPKQDDRDVHFIAFFYGINNDTPFDFFLDVKSLDANPPSAESVLDIAIVGQYMHQTDKQTAEFIEFKNKFPKWTVASSWFSSYESIVI